MDELHRDDKRQRDNHPCSTFTIPPVFHIHYSILFRERLKFQTFNSSKKKTYTILCYLTNCLFWYCMLKWGKYVWRYRKNRAFMKSCEKWAHEKLQVAPPMMQTLTSSVILPDQSFLFLILKKCINNILSVSLVSGYNHSFRLWTVLQENNSITHRLWWTTSLWISVIIINSVGSYHSRYVTKHCILPLRNYSYYEMGQIYTFLEWHHFFPKFLYSFLMIPYPLLIL